MTSNNNVRLVRNVRVKGIASAVPQEVKEVSSLYDTFGVESIDKIIASTGVERRHVVSSECSSDLCLAAAERLITDMSINKDSIDTLIFVSQTHDYTLPATACVLQERLGLSMHVAAFDVAMGCSGYVYGLWTAASLLSGGGSKRALLLVGDTISRIASPVDRSVAALFGDAGTATILDFEEGAPDMHFILGTDGRGAPNLVVPSGGFRDRDGTSTSTNEEGVRGPYDLYMNGAEIFAFTLARVPALVNALHDVNLGSAKAIDKYVFHQANRFMLDHLVKRMKLDREKVVLDVKNVGNTSCASIPLAITLDQRDNDATVSGRFMLAGFGVGYSWAGCIAEFDNVWVSPLTVTLSAAGEAMS
ncbi:ketoacyl-ACP synthase III [Pseudomonas fluorescens group sp.]|uniref:3-oxoacyl-[acyl-carrier-protein] synthase III n=2 Tax=Pseudomonas fluorescens TaxID=294 RepID=C3K727_PSEFS|nr:MULTISPECIES: ketoacyl-ACP synthase III [Pseudomonas fluorescens group]MBZ6456751.1 ketoacyl-ACP synthase III [Pseudomonas fluorescens group sp.]MBZ6461018.1 ketoacyl-ACP synthase III [Pseudomonas fluorescens group sp.]MBZ6469120.1 ketoacyl-ACP synthase III [Pseudomonas fluorescens group sp.]WQD73955.1 ketoacyl-ACP synthase III [Pseudomonas marginalis]CAI2795946.1 Putative 3-oxoacyl-[acyl-carrier-protein] synthase III [Pseudomonas fluorescens SBW25]